MCGVYNIQAPKPLSWDTGSTVFSPPTPQGTFTENITTDFEDYKNCGATSIVGGRQANRVHCPTLNEAVSPKQLLKSTGKLKIQQQESRVKRQVLWGKKVKVKGSSHRPGCGPEGGQRHSSTLP